MRRAPCCFAALLGALTAVAAGAAAHRVADLDPRVLPRGSSPGSFVALGSAVFFTAFDDVAGRELWRTDGTPAGTERLLDLCPGSCSGDPSWLSRLGDRLVFTANDGEHGTELWTSDGTAAGTRMMADLCPGACGAFLSPAYSSPVVFHDKLIFDLASDAAAGVEPWVSDGTVAGTRRLADLCPGPCGSYPSFLGQNDVAVLFQVGSTLYRTDGTPEGTFALRTFGSCCQNHVAVAFHDELWFGANGDGSVAVVSDELWHTDAAVASVALASDIVPGWGASFAAPRFVFDDHLYVSASSPQCPGTTSCLYREDGDPATPIELSTDVVAPGERPGIARRIDDALYYFADQVLYIKRPGEPRLALGAFSDTYEGFPLVPFGAGIAFSPRGAGSSGELWLSDGTLAGTRRIVDLGTTSTASDAIYNLAPTPFGLVFCGDDGTQPELWTSNGTAAGTRRIDLRPDIASSNPSPLATLGDRLLFNATDASGGAGSRLWTSDGTAGGTAPILAGGASSAVRWGDRLFVAANEPPAGSGLFVSDGEHVERVVALPTPEELALGLDGRGHERLYFSVAARSGQQLWSSDGTAGGTQQVIDVNPDYTEDWGGVPLGHTPLPQQITPLGWRVLFMAFGPRATGAELWASDGTAPGTYVVRSFWSYDDLRSLGDRAVFVVYQEGVASLCSTDGTSGGTQKLLPLLAYGSSYGADVPRLAVRGHEAFIVAPGAAGAPVAPGGGDTLWRTDGTPAGTYAVTPLRRDDAPVSAAGSRREILVSGQRLFFVASSATTGRELWTSDGTAAGTRVLEIRPGMQGARPARLAAGLPGQVVFAADDGTHGVEAWTSDGSPPGTRLLADAGPGAESSSPGPFVAGATRVYFAATDPTTGRELWTADLDAPATCVADARTLCLYGGRFAARVRYRNQHAQGAEGDATALPDAAESGRFWFFSADNVELALKLLDGSTVNGQMWLYVTALSDLEYWVEITDLATFASRTWHHPPGTLCGIADTSALPNPAPSRGPADSAAAASGAADDSALFLLQGRYEISATWSSLATGAAGAAHPQPFTDLAGGFWFFSANNPELVVKLLDGTSVNGHPWFFWGALSDLDVTITLRDRRSGAVETVHKPGRQTCGGARFDLF